MLDKHKAAGSVTSLAEQVRAACIEAAIQGYEHAAMSGLCGEGALEAAISAMRMLDLSALGKPVSEHPGG